jgi:TPR repeat protein
MKIFFVGANLDKNNYSILFSLLLIFFPLGSNAGPGTAEPCLNVSNNDDLYFENFKDCSKFTVNVPLLDPSSRQAGSEFSTKNKATTSTAQKSELDRLFFSAEQAEAASKSAQIAKSGAANSAWVLGLLYLHGTVITADPNRAKYWFQIAWQQGEQIASAGLAWCEMMGCGMPPNLANARQWRSQLAKINRPRSLYFEWLDQSKLAPLKILNESDRNVKDEKTSRRMLLVDAANAGDIHAHIELGIESAANNQLDEALKHFIFAESMSAVASSNASHIRKNIANSTSLVMRQQSVTGKDELAESSMTQALRYHRGDGIPANYSEAVRLYKKAADLGNAPARKMLNLIFSKPTEEGNINIPWMQKLSQLDLSGSTPKLSQAFGPNLLNREETGLTDFIPKLWTEVTPPKKLPPVTCLLDIAPC